MSDSRVELVSCLLCDLIAKNPPLTLEDFEVNYRALADRRINAAYSTYPGPPSDCRCKKLLAQEWYHPDGDVGKPGWHHPMCSENKTGGDL